MQAVETTTQITPNSFLIGVQKAATTSVYDWLSQHPEICAPLSLKDLDFFSNDQFYVEKGMDYLSDCYQEVYDQESVIFQGSVHYIYFEHALERIAQLQPDAKFVLILRNPIERAISAYEYALKFDFDTLPIEEAFAAEESRIAEGDHKTLSECTYKTHGLYYKQIQTFLKYFKPEQLAVLLFDDVSIDPAGQARKLFQFLEVDPDFEPEFRQLNNTGELQSKKLQQLAFGENKIRNFIVRKVMPIFLSEDQKAKLRWKVIHMNTKTKRSNYLENLDPKLHEQLREYYRDDLSELSKYLKRDLKHWLD